MSDYKPVASNSDIEKTLDKFKNIDLPSFAMLNMYPKIELSEIDMPELETISITEHIEKVEEYQRKSLEMLQSINANTANLYTLVDLISKSNEKQDQMLGLITEILTIAKAKGKREAESIFKKVVTKINDSVETADSVIKLIGWATAIYNMVILMLPQ